MSKIVLILSKKYILLILNKCNNRQRIFYSDQDFKCENRTVSFFLSRTCQDASLFRHALHKEVKDTLEA